MDGKIFSLWRFYYLESMRIYIFINRIILYGEDNFFYFLGEEFEYVRG